MHPGTFDTVDRRIFDFSSELCGKEAFPDLRNSGSDLEKNRWGGDSSDDRDLPPAPGLPKGLLLKKRWENVTEMVDKHWGALRMI